MKNARTSRWARALQTSSVALGVVVACTVVDKDDYTFRDGDAGAGGEAMGGASGKGGTSGTSGASGKGGTSGRGGSSGSGGSAGAPGGEGGEPGVPGGSTGDAGEGGQPAGECGDGTQGPGEDCDDGNRDDEECEYFATECSGCSSSCRRIRPPSCGDGAVNGARATSMTLEYAATSCVTTPGPVPLWLNGVAIPSLPWGTSCSCGTGVQTVEVTDAAVLAALRQDGNYLSFTTPATNEYIAWAVLTAVFDNGTRVSRVALDIGAPGDAEARNPGVAACPDPYSFLSLGAAVGSAFGGFPVEQCDGGADCSACSASLQCVTLTSADAFAIPDYDATTLTPGTVTSSLVLPEVGSIKDVDVTVDVTHTYVSDLALSLASPLSGAVLASRVGGSGMNYTATQFDQACTVPISSGVAPFTGCFLPQESLDTFLGRASGGKWSFTVTDNASSDLGVLAGWKLRVCGSP